MFFEQLPDPDIINQQKMCSTCCGFYGPSFGQPFCQTCHEFLFPEDVNALDFDFLQGYKRASAVLGREEHKLDLEFQEWEEQFEGWKEQNINHPDKEAFARYEHQWQEWREQLLKKKNEQMSKKRQELLAALNKQIEDVNRMLDDNSSQSMAFSASGFKTCVNFLHIVNATSDSIPELCFQDAKTSSSSSGLPSAITSASVMSTSFTAVATSITGTSTTMAPASTATSIQATSAASDPATYYPSCTQPQPQVPVPLEPYSFQFMPPHPFMYPPPPPPLVLQQQFPFWSTQAPPPPTMTGQANINCPPPAQASTSRGLLPSPGSRLNKRPMDYNQKTNSEDSGNEVIKRPRLGKLGECITALSWPRRKEIIEDSLVENLPAEVLAAIFSFFDDLSLWNCSQVCRKWSDIINAEISEEKWQLYTKRRWPLFKPSFVVPSWQTMYSKLAQSASCMQCLHRMTSQVVKSNIADEECWAARMNVEVNSLQTIRTEGIEAVPLDEHYCNWQASITGPVDSPYEGGKFFLHLRIPNKYPFKPPVVRFITKIYHPNVSCHGDIGIDSLHEKWIPAFHLSKILICIQSLFTDPYCHVCMEPEVGKLYQENRAVFDATARLWTVRYAMCHSRPPLPDH